MLSDSLASEPENMEMEKEKEIEMEREETLSFGSNGGEGHRGVLVVLVSSLCPLHCSALAGPWNEPFHDGDPWLPRFTTQHNTLSP